MSEPYVPQLIYYPERDEYEFVTEDIPTVERALVPDDSVGLLLRLQEPREAIGFRIAGALVRRVSPLSDGDGWQAIESAPQNRKLLVAYRNPLGNWRIVTGCYHTQLPWSDDTDHDPDDEFAPVGWYEESDSNETIWPTASPPTHWRPLPAAPRDEVV